MSSNNELATFGLAESNPAPEDEIISSVMENTAQLCEALSSIANPEDRLNQLNNVLMRIATVRTTVISELSQRDPERFGHG